MIMDNTYLSFLSVLSYFPVSIVRLTRRTPVRWGYCHCTSLGTVLRTRTTPRRGGATRTRNRDLEGSKEMFYLKTHSTHFIYGYMASNIW